MENSFDQDTILASRLQRIGAFVIDNIVIGIIGFLSGLLLADFYMSLGNYGRLIGFAAVLVYFTFSDSFFFAGQTIGKKIMGIKVVNCQSKLISIQLSFARSLIYSFTVLLNGLTLSNPKYAYIILFTSFILFSICLFELYYFFLYKKTGRFFHDVLSKTFVVKQSNGTIPIKVSRKIVRWSLIIPVIAVFLITITNYMTPALQINDMVVLANSIQTKLPLNNAMVTRGVTRFYGTDGSSETKYVAITALKKNKTDSNENLAVEIARIAISSGFSFQKEEILSIQINTGYDIAIARNITYESFRSTLEEWNKKLNE